MLMNNRRCLAYMVQAGFLVWRTPLVDSLGGTPLRSHSNWYGEVREEVASIACSHRRVCAESRNGFLDDGCSNGTRCRDDVRWCCQLAGPSGDGRSLGK